MMNSSIKQARVLELLREGWELGMSATGDSPHAWMQRKLCCGGDSYRVNLSSFYALRKKGLIEQLPRRKRDGFWLNRYGLSKSIGVMP